MRKEQKILLIDAVRSRAYEYLLQVEWRRTAKSGEPNAMGVWKTLPPVTLLEAPLEW